MVTRFGIIRHAPTLWNEQKRIQGQGDSPLSEKGTSMARAWGNLLAPFNWDRMICSDLGRTRQTAELVNGILHLDLQQDRRLREQHWGDWTGMTLQDVQAKYHDTVILQESLGWDFRPPKGESRQEVLGRSLEALYSAAETWPGENILVVCHEGVLKCLLYDLLDRRFLPEEPRVIQPYNLHLFEMTGNRLHLVAMNRVDLLKTSRLDETS